MQVINRVTLFTDELFGCGWDSTHMQPDEQASFTVFGGGKSADIIFESSQEKLVQNFIPGINKIFTGADKIVADKQIKICWAKQPFAKAGYTSFKKGQYSTIVGWEAAPIDNIYFAGEHVSGQFQGFMNGAAETGKKAAEQIAAKFLINIKERK